MQDATQTTPKAEIQQTNIQLLVWWDYTGNLDVEQLPRNQTSNSNGYGQQLAKLSDAVREKRPEVANCKGVVFQNDNAKPHISLNIRQKLL